MNVKKAGNLVQMGVPADVSILDQSITKRHAGQGESFAAPNVTENERVG